MYLLFRGFNESKATTSDDPFPVEYELTVNCESFHAAHLQDAICLTATYSGQETKHILGHKEQHWDVCFVMNDSGKTIQTLRAPTNFKGEGSCP